MIRGLPQGLARFTRAVVLMAVVGAMAGCVQNPQASARASDNGLIVVADNTLASGDTATALRLYREAATARGGSAQALVRYGKVLFSSGQYDFAAGAFAEALNREPWNREAVSGLGVAQLADGRLEEAEPNLEQVVRKAADARSVRNLAVLRMLQGQTEEARLLHRKALARWPQDLDLRSNFALAEAIDNQCETALKLAHEAVTSPFARSQHVAIYALVLAMCGQEREAREAGRGVMSEAGVDNLIHQVEVARQTEDPAQRALALGVVPAAASGVMAAESKLLSVRKPLETAP